MQSTRLYTLVIIPEAIKKRESGSSSCIGNYPILTHFAISEQFQIELHDYYAD
jgi:hypothetical protein